MSPDHRRSTERPEGICFGHTRMPYDTPPGEPVSFDEYPPWQGLGAQVCTPLERSTEAPLPCTTSGIEAFVAWQPLAVKSSAYVVSVSRIDQLASRSSE